MTNPTGPTTLIENPDEFNGIVEHLGNAWSATVDLAVEPLRPHEVKQQRAYLAAVPDARPWGANVTVHVVGNVIYVGRNDNPENGWVMTADENDALMAVQQEAGRRARLNTPAPPDAA